MYYTYVLSCDDVGRNRRKFYIGITDDLRARLYQHRAKNVKTTKSFNNLKIVYYEACLNKQDAQKRELQLKTGFGRGYIKKRLKHYLERAELV